MLWLTDVYTCIREHTNYRKEDLIFGTPLSGIDLSLFHPPPAQIFKLWQLYLDNVDPLLKVTHTPTLQSRIIDAISDLSSVGSALNCLLFAIYCIAVLTLQRGESESWFGMSKEDLLVSGRCKVPVCYSRLHVLMFETG
jgi:hypothetical protein